MGHNRTSIRTQVAIAGGGTGGFAAALAVARLGYSVVVAEETDWLGGQLTSQGVPPDENPWIESRGCTASYRSFRNGVRAYYKRNMPLTEAAMANGQLNPGNGGVSRLCHDPRVGVAVLNEMLVPYVMSGRVVVLYRHKITAVETDGDYVRSFVFRSLESGVDTVVQADYFLDATELGDVLPLAGAEYVSGAESQKDTGEPHAALGEAQPLNMQPISHCFAIDLVPGEDNTIDRPRDYDFWRDYTPSLTPAWPGKLLSWDISDNITLQPRTAPMFVRREDGSLGGLWTFRRIMDKRNFREGFCPSDISLVNWVMMDYWLGPICEVDEGEVARHREGARQLSLSLLYWIQTEAPRHDGGYGYPEVRLRKDVMGTEDGLAKYPYVRESRRIKAEFTVLEQHVASDIRGPYGAERFDDSVGIGYYRIDLHPSTGGNNYIDIGAAPFQIPLGSLIPVRMENLLPACKNLGVTHITNGCYRLHPVEWNIGEAAGVLAAFCLEKRTVPRRVYHDQAQLREFQGLLVKQGIELEWPPFE